jgi:plasmid stabilization system protein ParE
MSKYEIIVSEAAFAMLDAHVDFLARVNKDAAFKLLDEILGDISKLAVYPERNPVYDNSFIPKTIYRKMMSSRRYLILYEISAKTVFVDYIIDCRQDYRRILF